MINTTSITDKPISSSKEDKLKSKRYAETLASFIQKSDTPLTVGLQGEWGTGKTSMMYMLREILDQADVATSWVNTWEYSMFRGANETTPAVLRGMLEKLKESCAEKGTWTDGDDRSQKVQRIGRFIGNLANQVVRNQTGLDVKEAAEGGGDSGQISTEISFIKKQINEVIEDLIKDGNNKYNRVVFFVDDLDRIPPTDAVEVLEALKNMFDVPNCIYVLAIDYDVVVKGLEGKFGKKTEENEREFRSFFDKIIQVPFSMPTGTYDIKELLIDKLSTMGIEIPKEQEQAFSDVVKFTVGFNPRSLKRFMNSFSLLRSLRELDVEDSDEDSDTTEFDDLVLFAILGLQISYNKVFRIIAQSPLFWEWNVADANKFKVNLEEVHDQIKSFGDNMKDKTDELWEQIIYGVCHTKLTSGVIDPYLSARWESIVDVLNLLATITMSSDFKKAKSIETFETAWNNGLSLAAITNVDDDPGLKSKTEGKRKHISFDTIEGKEKAIIESGAKKNLVALWKALAEKIREEDQFVYKLNGSNIAVRNSANKKIATVWNPSGGRASTLSLYINYSAGSERPNFKHEAQDFNPAKNDAFKIQAGELSDLENVIDIMKWANSTY